MGGALEWPGRARRVSATARIATLAIVLASASVRADDPSVPVGKGPTASPPADPRCRARHSEPSLAPPPVGTRPTNALFPQELRPLKPYLQLADRFGTNAIKPDALFVSDPLSDVAQAVKTELAKFGVRYSLEQALVVTTESNRVKGDPVLGAYRHSFFGNWTIFESDAFGGTCGWLTFKSEGTVGLGVNLDHQGVASNIGAIASPNSNYSSEVFAIEQLAWAQSFADGEVVLLLGQINQTNYLDINRYANSEHGQFMNAALVNSMVLPAPGNNLAVDIQWQPVDWCYLMFGAGPNNQAVGESPFTDISSDNMSYVGEIGFPFEDVGGIGPGTFRVQPFLATVNGEFGGGVAFNVEQQLGRDSPFGAFARVGFGDDVTASLPGAVRTQVGAGLAILSPFVRREDRDYTEQANNDFAGIGFVWSRPASAPGDFHDDEFALELTCAFQITPTATIQPDLQLVWDPINNPDGGPSTVFQIQLNIAW